MLSLLSLLSSKASFGINPVYGQALGLVFLLSAAGGGLLKLGMPNFVLVTLGVLGIALGQLDHSSSPLLLMNSITILFSFPIVLAATRNVRPLVIFNWIILASMAVVLFGVVSGQISVSYIGDFRGSRWVLGFQRPTFLAESMFLTIVALVGCSRERRFRSQIAFAALIAVALAVQVKSGSRAGLGASLLFLYLYWESNLRVSLKTTTVLLSRFIILGVLIWLAASDLDMTTLSRISSARITIVASEVTNNIRTFEEFIFGNPDAQEAFNYDFERLNKIYHMDNFFAERLVIVGVFGLSVILGLVYVFYRQTRARWARKPGAYAPLLALIWYGLFEHGIFNLTSFFAVSSLAFTALLGTENPLQRPLSRYETYRPTQKKPGANNRR